MQRPKKRGRGGKGRRSCLLARDGFQVHAVFDLFADGGDPGDNLNAVGLAQPFLRNGAGGHPTNLDQQQSHGRWVTNPAAKPPQPRPMQSGIAVTGWEQPSRSYCAVSRAEERPPPLEAWVPYLAW